MHLAPDEILHVFEAGDRRSEVQHVNEEQQPFRVVYQTKKSGEVVEGSESRYWTHAPSYHKSEDIAKQRARTWAYNN